MTPLHYAASYGEAEAIRVLHELGADLESRDKRQMTPVHFAAGFGHADTIRVLTELGALELDAQTTFSSGRWSPLLVASRRGHMDCVKALFSVRGKPQTVDAILEATKRLPASERLIPDIAKIIADFSAPVPSVFLENRDGKTARGVAA